MADAREHQFQQDIIDELTRSGWLVGEAGQYDRTNALYPEDLVGFVQAAYPENWEKFTKKNPQAPEQALINQVARDVGKHGTLEVLRRGIKDSGAHVPVCAFQPDHAMNPDALARYEANRLRVVPEVAYSPHARPGEYNPRLDLVLFVNGIPTATLELKSSFKQSVDNAKRQYCKDRPTQDPKTRKNEPLLTFKRGALVHFAVSQDEVAMTTRLAGDDTVFLPFNRGTEDGGAGNPPPANADDYASAHLWREVLQPDAWLRVIGRYLHLEKKTEEDFDGRRKTQESLIFPRYHQWDAVTRLIGATSEEGAGQRYLIQHSAGSGKSNSIAWLAHQLAALYSDDGGKLFQSVVVVTDRNVLDSQLQDTIYQFEHAHGVVQPITHDVGNQSKSEQLADALSAQARIIIVTIQTFPALFDALEARPQLAQGRYAVIADEAHSSQTGAAATKLKAVLGAEFPEDEVVSAEQLLDAAVQAREPAQRISYYAFTATPKAKTLELFGRPRDPSQPKSAENPPEPFHVYSMRQAIEEGFILDVLKNYTTYTTAWRLAHPDGEAYEVDSRKASARLARWVKLHPVNIGQKVEVIVEHFRTRVRHLLQGQGKAMVVTASRQEAVRYALAMREFVNEQGYDDVRPLVAFSGTVQPDDTIPEEVTEQSSLLNPGLKGRDLREAFDTDGYNVMIVANKFQTGFDQPKLCAMYVDKRLNGVDCVQTLSRLNRVFPGKETFILDFVNDPEDVIAAFQPYYQTAQLADVSDPNVVYDLQRKLDASGIYQWDEVRGFAHAFFDPKAPAARLSYYCAAAKDRFAKRYDQAREAYEQARATKQRAEAEGDGTAVKHAQHDMDQAGEALDELDTFKKDLQSFVRSYEFLSQIISYEDTDLEALCVFAKHLHPLLRVDRLSEDGIDLSELQLTHYRITKREERRIDLAREEGGDYQIKPPNEVGSGAAHEPDTRPLAEIIQRLNDLFGAEVTDDDKLQFARSVAERIQRNESVVQEVQQNSPDQVMHGRFPKQVEDAVMDLMSDNQQMANEILDDNSKNNQFAELILKLLVQQLNGGGTTASQAAR